MARTKGSKTKKKCWRIKVVQGDEIVYQKEYTTLQEASLDLDMSYCQLFELAPNGRSKKVKKHKFAPEIIIEKITPLKKKKVVVSKMEQLVVSKMEQLVVAPNEEEVVAPNEEEFDNI
tara:strand:- start:156 stop:509 length:354 start_codon:yes stop_codon:yes gene_type:complete